MHGHTTSRPPSMAQKGDIWAVYVYHTFKCEDPWLDPRSSTVQNDLYIHPAFLSLVDPHSPLTAEPEEELGNDFSSLYISQTSTRSAAIRSPSPSVEGQRKPPRSTNSLPPSVLFDQAGPQHRQSLPFINTTGVPSTPPPAVPTPAARIIAFIYPDSPVRVLL